MKPIGLYIHVPFCENKCPYCDFYSQKASETLINQYIQAVCRTLINYSKVTSLAFDTIYFGGGTPSLLGNANISKIMGVICENFECYTKEITLEINPTSSQKLNFLHLKEIGINRLSIGVQSAVDEELKLLERKHSTQDAELTIKKAKNAGFENISLDLMVAIPGQTKNSLQKSIDFCISQNVQHISAYLLKIEKNTAFYKMKSQLDLKTDDEEAELYLYLVETLEKHGFKQYEISNFAKEGYQGQHNLKYWNADEYLGIGPSAYSFLENKRFFYPHSLHNFLSENRKIIDDGNGGSPEEYVMLKLRLRDGVNNEDFKKRFGFDVPKIYFENARLYQKYDLTYVDNSNIRLTPQGFLLSNSLISRIEEGNV